MYPSPITLSFIYYRVHGVLLVRFPVTLKWLFRCTVTTMSNVEWCAVNVAAACECALRRPSHNSGCLAQRWPAKVTLETTKTARFRSGDNVYRVPARARRKSVSRSWRWSVCTVYGVLGPRSTVYGVYGPATHTGAGERFCFVFCFSFCCCKSGQPFLGSCHRHGSAAETWLRGRPLCLRSTVHGPRSTVGAEGSCFCWCCCYCFFPLGRHDMTRHSRENIFQQPVEHNRPDRGP
jgi:hypothetical protein